MEYFSDSSDAGLEANDQEERNKLPSAHDSRLEQYRTGAVNDEEVEKLAVQLNSK